MEGLLLLLDAVCEPAGKATRAAPNNCARSGNAAGGEKEIKCELSGRLSQSPKS